MREDVTELVVRDLADEGNVDAERGGAGSAGVSNRTPSETMSCAKMLPSWSSATWPTKATSRPSAAAPAMLFAADPPLISRAGPIAA